MQLRYDNKRSIESTFFLYGLLDQHNGSATIYYVSNSGI